MRSIYFTDPNGIALEASWWVIDATGRDTDYGDEHLFADPDPVPAFRELARDGRLASTPTTALAHEPDVVVDPAETPCLSDGGAIGVDAGQPPPN